MTDATPRPIPTTFEMIERTKRPKVVSNLDRVENYSLVGLLILGVLTGAAWALHVSGWASKATVEFLLTSIVGAMVVIVAIWGGTQIVEAFRAWRAGYRPMAERIDAAVARERTILDELAECDPQELRERAKHLELEAKVLGRRAGLVTVVGAIAVALTNVFDTAAKASVWPEFPYAKLLVYTSSIGFFIGSLLLVILVGKLERIAGLFALAADRNKT